MKFISIGVAFITHNSVRHLKHCLPPIVNSPLRPRVVVVNSSGDAETEMEAKKYGAEILQIPKIEFNHGMTREKARKYLNTDIVVMMTPDAYAIDELMLEKLVRPIVKKEASLAYARQIPHEGANFFESFSRNFNYPEKSHVRTIQDVEKYGIYTYFVSDSCAAYNQNALDEIGGFQHVLLGEDTVACAKLLHKGHKAAYAADAIVQHSHRYSLMQEFRRNFDTGLARQEYREILSGAGTDYKRGRAYVMEMLKTLAKEKPTLIPYGITQSVLKALGYKIGSMSSGAPLFIKKALSSQGFYWDSL